MNRFIHSFLPLPGVVGCILGGQVGALVDCDHQGRLLEAVLDGEQELAQPRSVLVLRVVDRGQRGWWGHRQTRISLGFSFLAGKLNIDNIEILFVYSPSVVFL